ncbi:MAG TPA: glutathione S-transferase family protein [Ferrovibrio sp.]|uniref:glutathione S-transferase family protein n=1 Tax=Ferrovibrio sp. TaxID=1917215 RepID=UPI002ECFC818
MALMFYYGSGSPYAWRVWLALEHKGIAYELRVLSFEKGETRSPDYTAINPRQKVPTIVDGDFVLAESAVILDYLDEAYPGPRLFSADVKQRAQQRRLIVDSDDYYAKAFNDVVDVVIRTKPEQRDPAKLAAARAALAEELAVWEGRMPGQDFMDGTTPAAVDFVLFPRLILIRRFAQRMPEMAGGLLGPKTEAWLDRMQALEIVRKTWPPHWT